MTDEHAESIERFIRMKEKSPSMRAVSAQFNDVMATIDSYSDEFLTERILSSHSYIASGQASLDDEASMLAVIFYRCGQTRRPFKMNQFIFHDREMFDEVKDRVNWLKRDYRPDAADYMY